MDAEIGCEAVVVAARREFRQCLSITCVSVLSDYVFKKNWSTTSNHRPTVLQPLTVGTAAGTPLKG